MQELGFHVDMVVGSWLQLLCIVLILIQNQKYDTVLRWNNMSLQIKRTR